MLGDVEVHDATTLMSQHDEDEEHPAWGGRHGEAVTRHDVLDVVIEEGLPRGRGRFTSSRPILLHRGFGHADAELTEFSHDAR